MGTSAKHIATHSNVANKRINPGYATSAVTATKCVTKERITPIEFLQVDDRSTAIDCCPTSVNTYLGNGSPTISMNISQGSSYNSYITSSNTIISGREVCCLMYANVYNSNTPATVKYTASWPGGPANAKYFALYKRTLTVPTNQILCLNFIGNLYCLISDSISSTAGSNICSPTSVTWYGNILITDSNDNNIISSSAISYCTSASYNKELLFSSAYSTINVYFIITSINMNFVVPYEEYYCGFCVNCNCTLTYYDSYYDQTYKCVQYQDISHPASKTFTVYYGIWNNKSSNAKLDTVTAKIKKSTDSSWTDIGSKSIGTVDSTLTGSFTCTLPSNFDPTVSYDFTVTCGQTNLNQSWSYKWGNSSSALTSTSGWTSYSSSAKTGACTNSYGLNGDSLYATLNNYRSNSYSTNYGYGRSTSYAALFRIT